MGYLNSQLVTVDAILTKKGRELLSRGDNSFKITQFALADDEIDYSLYNISHPLGSAYYGEAIENMPLLEAFPDETQMMKYKLLSLKRGTSKIPIINLGYSQINLIVGGKINIIPSTENLTGISSETYNFTIFDARLFSDIGGSYEYIAGTNLSETITGSSLSLTAVNSIGDNLSLSTTLMVVGVTSGAQIQIRITITDPQGSTTINPINES